MGDQRNYAALDWVLGEIEDTLNDARQALESYVENPKDTTQLRFCVTHVHQVRGSLQIVEFHGASLLAEEMENLAQAIIDQRVSNIDDAHEVLMRSLLHLPIYLDYVKVYRDDSARSILPLLNDIRAIRKEIYLSETDLFTPDLGALHIIHGKTHPVLNDVAKLKQVTSKLREMYQFAAASVIRNIKVRDNLAYIEKVFERLILLTSGTKISPLWLISAAFIEGLKKEEIELSVAVQGLLRYLARELRLLSEQAPTSFHTTPREGLVKNLLYYIGRTESQEGLIKQIKDSYLIKASEVKDGEENVDGYNVSALDPEAVRSVVVALREELKSIKSNLDTVMSAQLPPSELVEILPVVKRVADTLAVLGISELRQKMLLQADALAEISRRESLDTASLINSANDIIDVDAKLEAIGKAVDRHRDISNINERKIEIDEAKLAVIRECQVGLEKAKEAIIDYISSQWDVERLENIDHLLYDIRGGLDMIPLPRAGEIIGNCSRFIVEHLCKKGEEPSWQTLESLADAMAGVEYFLERLSNDMSEDAESLLDIAEQSMRSLGYGSSEKEIFEQVVDSIEPSSEEVLDEPIADSAYAVVSDSSDSLGLDEKDAEIPSLEAIDHSDFSTDSSMDDDDDGSDIDEEIIEIFIEEAEEVCETLDDAVPKWIAGDDDALGTVRRAYHTLKGSGRMVEAMEVGELAWAVENMLNRVIDQSVPYQEEHGQFVLSVGTIIPTLIQAFKARTANPQKEIADRYISWAFAFADGRVPDDFDPNISVVTEPVSALEDSPVETTPQVEEEPDEEDYALLEIFSSEVETHLATMTAFVYEMEQAAPLYSPPSDDLQRALHTLKGSAKMAQVWHIAQMYEAFESFAKEMVTFQVPINDDILQLTRDAAEYTLATLTQIQQRQPVEIAKLGQFLARTAELRELSVGHLVRMKELAKDGEKPVDPRLLSIFMAEEMNLLLDADEIVDKWCLDPSSEPRIPELASELKTLSVGADQAKLPDMSGLASTVSFLYEKLLSDVTLIDEQAHIRLKSAHDALLDMVDAVAAGQNVVPPSPIFIESFEQYVEGLSSEPAADEEIELQDSDTEQLVETDQLDITEPDSNDTVAADAVSEDGEDLLLEGEEQQPLESLSAFDVNPIDSTDTDSGTHDTDSTTEYSVETLESYGEEVLDKTFSDPSEASDVSDDADQLSTQSTNNIELPLASDIHQPTEMPSVFDAIDAESEDFDADILEVFLEECDELFEDLDGAIHSWESESDIAAVEEMKRALHTMKGGARLAGLKALGDLVHDYESFLISLNPADANESVFATIHDYQDRSFRAVSSVKQQAGQGEVLIEPEVTSNDALPTDVGALETTDTTPQGDESSSLNVVPFVGKPKQDVAEQQSQSIEPFIGVNGSNVAAMPAKKAGPQEVIRVNSDLLEELVNLAGETSISRSRLEEQVTEFRLSLDEIDSTIDRLQEQLRRLDIETEAQILFRQEQIAVHEESFDPLEMDRYSQLQQLSRSLIESASDLYDLRSDLSNKVKDAETTLLQQSRINTTLQEGLMRSRMVPFSRLVPRLRRIVRQVASELGKKVSFELDNIEGELDRNVLERMVPPFEHMLRNAVDHGIEGPEERQAAGKSETGRIVLTLGREGGNVSIRLADDGRGVDLVRVRNKAIERGLMSEDAELSDHDIMQFILHAGFSTAENITQISGRGVGMDVVNAEIKQLGGDVTINSQWGKGTEFAIQLPFTLSVNRALMVNIGVDQYAIPLNAIEGIVRISPFELEHYYSNPDSEFEYANEHFKVRYLGSLLYAGRKANLDGHVLPLPIVLVRTAQHTMALQVDSLMGSREIVVKSLGAQFSNVQGLSGATIMGDGSVVVILDLHAIVRQEIAKSDFLIDASKRAQLELQAESEQAVRLAEEQRVKTIMVVDDSVTVRKVTTRFLERQGYNVITAKDGVDALRVLQDEIPDLMLLDIEMPRMDGFEVAKNIRSTMRWKHLPIIMITSRTGSKHRDHAMSLGVNRYMGKPYQEDALAETIQELIHEHLEAGA